MRKFLGTFLGKMTFCALLALVLLAALPGVAAYAADDAAPVVTTAEESDNDGSAVKAVAAGAVITAACVAGAISMAHTIAKANEGISRQPEAADKIRTSLMLGLVFIETAIIYALIVAILIIFVL